MSLLDADLMLDEMREAQHAMGELHPSPVMVPVLMPQDDYCEDDDPFVDPADYCPPCPECGQDDALSLCRCEGGNHAV